MMDIIKSRNHSGSDRITKCIHVNIISSTTIIYVIISWTKIQGLLFQTQVYYQLIPMHRPLICSNPYMYQLHIHPVNSISYTRLSCNKHERQQTYNSLHQRSSGRREDRDRGVASVGGQGRGAGAA